MSDKTAYSLTRALQQTVEHGVPTTGFEREFHFESLRAIEKSPILAGRTGGKFHSLYAPVSIIHRDLSVSGGPASGGALVGLKTYGRSDLASWSAVIDSGAQVVTGLKESAVFWQVSALPQPSWTAETGMQVETDPTFVGFSCSPKRLAAITLVSKQLLAHTVDLDDVLLFDLVRQLGSLVDQVCLLGQGPSANQPTGIAATTGVHVIAGTTYDDFMHAQRLVADANVPLDFLATITSPAGKEILVTMPVVAGYPVFVWDRLTNPKSSPEVSDNKAYCGAWQMLTIAIWGSLEIQIDPYLYALTNQLRLIASLWVDVALRLPTAFATIGPLAVLAP